MNLEAFGIGAKPLPFPPWVRAFAVLAFGYLAITSGLHLLQGQLYSLFPLLIGLTLLCYFAVGRSLKPPLGVMIKYGVIAALMGAVVSGMSWVIWGRFIYGDFLLVITLPIFIVFSLLPALILALPLMWSRRYLSEPFYFLALLKSGFLAGAVVTAMFHGGNPVDPSAYVGWKMFGALGSVYAITAWLILRITEQKWLGRT